MTLSEMPCNLHDFSNHFVGVSTFRLDSIAGAGLWCPVARTGAVDVDEHLAGVVVADIAQGRDRAAVHSVMIEVLGLGCW